MPKLQKFNEDESKQMLIQFISEAYGFIARLIQDEKLYFSIFPSAPKELYGSCREAWGELPHSFTIEGATRQIKNASGGLLVKAGLFGAQLKLKLEALRYRMSQWTKSISRPVSKVAYKVLEAIDTVLDSLVQALGVGEALKEAKDVLMGLCE